MLLVFRGRVAEVGELPITRVAISQFSQLSVRK
jgi:hypothetical protein